MDKQAADSLLKYVTNMYEKKLAEVYEELDIKSREYWTEKTEQLRNALAQIVSGSEVLTDERRQELERIIITYDKIVFGIKIKSIDVKDDVAEVAVEETSSADIPVSAKMDGILRSESDSVYHLKKENGEWKVTSDEVLKETTTMLYGDARNLDIKLTAPEKINAGEEYTASLEFNPPANIIAIASIASDKVEYPQKQAKEVYRKFPDDNILERIFVSNCDNVNEYVVASIGLTKADVEDLSIKLSLTGFGYKIVRVNVVPKAAKEENNEQSK